MRWLAVALTALLVAPGLAAQERRGVVSGLSASEPTRDGTVQFTVRGTNPCGAVEINLGDGVQPVVHPISALPATVSSEYTKTGDFQATARGMGNCDGSAVVRVRVTSVRPAPPPPPPPTSAPPTRAPAAVPPTTAAIRFAAMDRNHDGVIARSEWEGSARSFEVHDWNGDGVLSGDEVRMGALRPDTPGRATSRVFTNWSESQFQALDRNRDGRISRSEWTYDVEDFYRADRNGDNFLALNEFLLASDVDDDRGDRFDDLDLNRNGRIERREWHGSMDAFDWLDRNRDGVLSRQEAMGADEVAWGRGTAGTRERPREIIVSAQRAWTDSGIDVRAGDVLTVTATGRIYYSTGAGEFADANGAANRPATPAAPLPFKDIGALVARIGNGTPFIVGTTLDNYRVDSTGRLFLGINDDMLTDNRGEFRVTVTVTRR